MAERSNAADCKPVLRIRVRAPNTKGILMINKVATNVRNLHSREYPRRVPVHRLSGVVEYIDVYMQDRFLFVKEEGKYEAFFYSYELAYIKEVNNVN